MNKSFEDFNTLKDSACKYMREDLFYAERTICDYERIWRQVRKFMFINGFASYTNKVGEGFLRQVLMNKNQTKIYGNRERNYRKQRYYKAVTSLDQFIENGTMIRAKRKGKPPLKFKGPIGEHISGFIASLVNQKKCPTTIRNHSRFLFDFMKYCDAKKVFSIDIIDLPLILIFISNYKNTHKTTMVRLTGSIRCFTSYLFVKELIKVDISRKIPYVKYVRQSKIPSVYSVEEIKKIMASIDKSTPMGKRNFAMILLAVRSGLRASDIVSLKFKELDWDKSAIQIEQYKTGVPLNLPLTADVGNAIIDYLKFGRPKCGSSYVFVRSKPPFENAISSTYFGILVQQAITKAGLCTKNRKLGSHSLRNSLAARMLENSTAINVITGVLGHKNSESTKHYIRIDLESMRTCVLEVPAIKSSFYEQGGGCFYG